MERATFGVRLPVAGPLASRGSIERATRAAEQLAFDTVWVHDFLAWTRFLDRAHVSCGSVEVVEEAGAPPVFHESITNLAFIAGLTSGGDIKIGVAVLCIPWRHPVIAARQLANIDVLSDGRLIVGIGVGAPKDRNSRDYETLGISRAKRYGRTKEYVRAMKAIWTEDVSSFDGEFVSFPPEEFFPKPAQRPHPPIWFGGSGPTTLRMIAELGDGWLPGLMTPADFVDKRQEIDRLAEEAGRDDFRLTVGAEITACIAPTFEEADRISQKTFESMTEGFPITLEQTYACALMGSPAEVQEQVARYVEAGVRHFELKFIYHSVDQLIEEMELFSKEIADGFR